MQAQRAARHRGPPPRPAPMLWHNGSPCASALSTVSPVAGRCALHCTVRTARLACSATASLLLCAGSRPLLPSRQSRRGYIPACIAARPGDTDARNSAAGCCSVLCRAVLCCAVPTTTLNTFCAALCCADNEAEYVLCCAALCRQRR
jgi:hypothetical protein